MPERIFHNMFYKKTIDDWRRKSHYGDSTIINLFCYIYNFELVVFSIDVINKKEHVLFSSHRGISPEDDLNELPSPTRGYIILKGLHFWVIVPEDYQLPKFNVSIKGKKC